MQKTYWVTVWKDVNVSVDDAAVTVAKAVDVLVVMNVAGAGVTVVAVAPPPLICRGDD